jgi:Protein of unknown function (DUF2924)
LGDLGLVELRTKWQDLYGRPAPRFFRRKLLVRGLAYQMQVQVHGGLSEDLKRRLREIAAAAREGTFDAAHLAPRIKPGTKLIRTWKKATHEVLAIEHGFVWRGQRYTSLSTIAKTITGTSWNGWRFFGLNRPKESADRNVRGMFKRPEVARNGKIMWLRSKQAAKRRAAARRTGAANA